MWCKGEQQEHEDAHEHPHWRERGVWFVWSVAEVCGRPHENRPQDWEAETLHRGELCFFGQKTNKLYFSAAKFSSTHTTEESTQKGSMKEKSKFQSHYY